MLNWDDPLAPVEQPAQPLPAEANPAMAEQAADKAAVDAAPQADVRPVNPDDKRVINGMTDINQLAPFKYPWAWEYFLNANRNHWTPLDIGMAQDVQDYHHKLTLEERHVYENVLSYLTTSDILAMRNIGLAVMEKMSAPELQIYQARQVYEESLHTWTYQHCIETIGLDQGEIYNRYRVVPEINGKIQIANRRLNSVLRADIDLHRSRRTAQLPDGLHLLCGRVRRLLVLQRLQPDLRPAASRPDEGYGRAVPVHHARRGAACLVWHPCGQADHARGKHPAGPDRPSPRCGPNARPPKTAYAGYILRDPILGYSKEDHLGQYRFIANRRARSLGLEEPYPGAEPTLGLA